MTKNEPRKPRKRKALAQGCGDPSGFLIDIVRQNRADRPTGIYSVCSANRYVLEAAMKQAAADDTILCVESTSNQVNQFGGYMGLRPAEFARFVASVASAAGFPAERIILGGDHLGPHPWQDEPAPAAMSKARELVRECVLAGYTKIHLDASMRCADDPGGAGSPLDSGRASERAAELCQSAETARTALPEIHPAPFYVIGTEVPTPGGEQHPDSCVPVTQPEDAERSITLARAAWQALGIESAWERTTALVVQTGADFGDSGVFEYDRTRTRSLSSFIKSIPGLIFEAHSTDYQPGWALRQMVEDHFAILKVGPALTFAFREAVFSLARMEEEWLSGKKGVSTSGTIGILDAAMLKNPVYWQKYYSGSEPDLRCARKYSYSDRSRYYWALPEVQQALRILVDNLTQFPVPLTLLSQYMSEQYLAVREGRLSNTPVDLIHDKIREVLDLYAGACRMRRDEVTGHGFTRI